MKSGVVVADSSPLYALVDRRDAYHERSINFVRSQRYEMYTTWAVVTEVVYLLRKSREDQLRFLRWARGGGLIVVDLTEQDQDRAIDVMEKYADLPADFADATLVAIADRLQINSVATFDRDFDVYRYRNKARFRNVLR